MVEIIYNKICELTKLYLLGYSAYFLDGIIMFTAGGCGANRIKRNIIVL